MKKKNLEKLLVILLLSFIWAGCSKGSEPGTKPALPEIPELPADGDNNPEGIGETIPEELPPVEETPPTGDPVNPPEFVFSALWEKVNAENHEWTLLTVDAIEEHGESLLSVVPEDIERFCPNYEQLDLNQRTQFWVHFLSTISKYESNFRPEVSFVENFNDRHGNPVISRGLLQLSVESGRGYRCVIPEEEDLHDPEVNLTCGIRIINRWIDRDGVISKRVTLSNGKKRWRGGARYWAVLRNPKRLNSIINLNKSQSYCKLN